MSDEVLVVSQLTKRFGPPAGGFTAVDGISFSIAKGEIVGLLGPNGAGKTTTIQMLLGLILPTFGRISYFGKDLKKDREYCLSNINYASADSQINSRLTVWQNLTIYAGLYNVVNAERRINEVLELLEAVDLKNELFWHLSSGQKTRVMVAKSLLNRPRLILMDEPTAFMDVEIAAKVTDFILQLQKKEQVSVLYTSHNMDEVEKMCDRVIFLNQGKIIAENTPLELTKRIDTATLKVTFDGEQEQVRRIIDKKKYQYQFPRKHVVDIKMADKEIPAMLFSLSKQGIWITEIDVRKPDLEDVFLTFARQKNI